MSPRNTGDETGNSEIPNMHPQLKCLREKVAGVNPIGELLEKLDTEVTQLKTEPLAAAATYFYPGQLQLRLPDSVDLWLDLKITQLLRLSPATLFFLSGESQSEREDNVRFAFPLVLPYAAKALKFEFGKEDKTQLSVLRLSSPNMERSVRHLREKTLGPLSVKELQQLETQLESTLHKLGKERLLPLYFPRDKHEEEVATSKLPADVGDENWETTIDERKIE
ncbi:hypothetical protein J5N97_022858 [Dioscorea zingiberensis]|uniref:Uncharacterized protein n=1 Tax=Dioscorea zingiberensis TaxID=325984 RepID=A0A9D5CAX7_9LILI|nr:hypothetical protein J5N97_022858 [Dioscorea zingiberensis]